MVFLLFCLVIFLQVYDGLSTMRALRIPTLMEGNVLARWVQGRMGIMGMVLIFKALGAALALFVLLGGFPSWFQVAIFLPTIAILSWVVVGNVRLIIRHTHTSVDSGQF